MVKRLDRWRVLRVVAALALLACGASGLLLWGFSRSTFAAYECSPLANAVAAYRARRLDRDALAALYRGTRAMVDAGVADDWGTVPSTRLPAAADAIHARYAQVSGEAVMFKLSGCLDDQVFVVVDLATRPSEQRIVLVPGELGKPELLWSAGPIPY